MVSPCSFSASTLISMHQPRLLYYISATIFSVSFLSLPCTSSSLEDSLSAQIRNMVGGPVGNWPRLRGHFSENESKILMRERATTASSKLHKTSQIFITKLISSEVHITAQHLAAVCSLSCHQVVQVDQVVQGDQVVQILHLMVIFPFMMVRSQFISLTVASSSIT